MTVQEKVLQLCNRLLRVGVEVKVITSIQGIQIFEINGKRVAETGLMHQGILVGTIDHAKNEIIYEDLSTIFNLIRKYK